MKKLLLFLGLFLLAGSAKAALWNDEPDVYTVSYSTSMSVSASTTAVMVSLSSTTWPHPTNARAIIVDSIQIDNDKAAALTSLVQVGVVREVNVSSGTIVWFETMGNTNNVSNTNNYQLITYFPYGQNCRVNPVTPNFGPNTGSTPYILSNNVTSGSALYTTALGYVNPVTGVADAKIRPGDIVMSVTNGATAAKLNVTIRYHIDTK